MPHRNKRSHSLRNAFLIFILLLVFGGAAYGMSMYRGVKNSVNSSFKSSGVENKQNLSKKLSEKKPISILLMGTDTGALGRDYKGRTDTMMIVTINPATNKTTMTSIPRDTAVNIPGFEDDSPAKINAAYTFGQAKTSIQTVQKMLNIPIDFYALINMGGMKKVVEEIGGIDITPTITFKYNGFTYIKGKKTHMNGKKALGYSRMRYDDPQGDYGRQKRQRDVLMAIIRESGSISTLLNQKFVSSLASQSQTDLTFDNLKVLAKGYRKATENVSQYHLQGAGKTVQNQSMEVMSKNELQRVTDIIRKGLGLKHSKSGNIAYGSDIKSKDSSKKKKKKSKKKSSKSDVESVVSDDQVDDSSSADSTNTVDSSNTTDTTNSVGSTSSTGTSSSSSSNGSSTGTSGNSTTGSNSGGSYGTGSSYGSGSSTGTSSGYGTGSYGTSNDTTGSDSSSDYDSGYGSDTGSSDGSDVSQDYNDEY